MTIGSFITFALVANTHIDLFNAWRVHNALQEQFPVPWQKTTEMSWSMWHQTSGIQCDRALEMASYREMVLFDDLMASE